MQLKKFPIRNGCSYSVRAGEVLIDLEIDLPGSLQQDDPQDGEGREMVETAETTTDLIGNVRSNSDANKFRTGKLGIYEGGELLKDWSVRITENGTVFCTDDDFYRALDLFASLTGNVTL